ncbi:MAG: DUF1772 domain-containing protein [Gammaproteobacteria bacterium]
MNWMHFMATFCAGLFTGTAVFVAVVQHSAATQLGYETYAKYFSLFYWRAALMQVSLALITVILGLVAWFYGAGFFNLIGALIFIALILYSVIYIKPIDDQLRAAKTEMPTDPESLLTRWGALHRLRAGGAALGFLFFLL